MIYRVDIEDKAQKKLDKLKDKILKKNIINKINELSHNPRKGKHLFKNFYELKAKNYRIYYAIFRGIVVIENIEGIVKVMDIGTKDRQKRDIKSL